MRVDVNWLKDFVDFDWGISELVDRLTMAGLEAYPVEDNANAIEIEITSNRSDWLSVLGVAREIAALKRIKINPIEICQFPKGSVDYELVVDKGCAIRYFGLRLDNIKVGHSPEWMRERLIASGLRPINNVVDITNYVMLLFGQPLHAFDFSLLEGGKLWVRRAKSGEEIVTLDGVNRRLDKSDIVIADAVKPVALAGIIGGENSEVGDNTVSVLLESALFPRVDIRRTRQRLAINTDASYRFERGVDPVGVEIACFYAAMLLVELAGAEGMGYEVYDEWEADERKVVFPLSFCKEYADVDIPETEQIKILEGLGFECEENKDNIIVTVPSFRQDISLKQDVLEEVLRIYGYSSVPTEVIGIGKNSLRRVNSFKESVFAKVRAILEARGFSEAISFSLISEKEKDALHLKGLLSVENTISQDYLFLRPSALSGLLSAIKLNFSYGLRDVKLYEISQSLTRDNACREKDILSAIVVDKELDSGFRQVMRVFEDLLGTDLIVKKDKSKAFSSFARIYSKDRQLGMLGKVRDSVLKKLGIKAKEFIWYLEVDLSVLVDVYREKKVSYKPIPVYPAVERDISMWVGKGSSHQDIVSIILKNGGQFLESARLIDVFHSPDGRVSYAYRLRFYTSERTLKEEEVASDFDAIVNALKSAGIDVRAL